MSIPVQHTPLRLCNARTVTSEGLRDDLDLLLQDGRIAQLLARSEPSPGERWDLGDKLVLPGFIDTQVNGGGGVLFNDAPTPETVATIAQAHAHFGTTGLLPTLITDHLEVVAAGVQAVDAAIAAGTPGVLGIHIEGPFLDEARRGIHDANRLQQLTDELVETLTPLRHGTTMITVAPEHTTPQQIARLVARGFVVSAGHSGADYDTVSAAIDAGISGFTHLFNAMSPLTSRAPGMVGAALDHAHTFAGIIADDHHLADASLRVALRCKGPEGLMLVTDAMPPVGTDASQFELHGKTIHVRDGACLDAQGTLAGAALDMARALRTVQRATGCSLTDASRMASDTPARFLGQQQMRGRIAAGLAADLAILDGEQQPFATVIAGQTVWQRDSH